MIKKRGAKFCLYSKKKGKDGERKNLGCYPSKKAAKERERQVQYFKHMGESEEMQIDYKQLEALVREAMFTNGGITEPSAPEGVPHRMPAADTDTPEHEKGDSKANELYQKALDAREATEELVEALDEPIFDAAYEHAFKASACLRRTLNAIEAAGAHPMPHQRTVAPPLGQQPYVSGGNMGGVNYHDGGYPDFSAGMTLEEAEMSSEIQAAAEAIKNASETELGYLLRLIHERLSK